MFIYTVFFLCGCSTDKPLNYTSGNAVDLGLSVKWADRNIGASTPEDYGGLYVWGDTIGAETLKNDNDYFYKNLPVNISGTIYDLALIKWGGNWRMPTEKEIDELLKNCTSKWDTINDVKGFKFTSKKGKSVFFPATGYRSWKELKINRQGHQGTYWSGTLCEDMGGEGTVYLMQFFYNEAFKTSVSRRYSFAIRPILDTTLSIQKDYILGYFKFGMTKNEYVQATDKFKKNVCNVNSHFTIDGVKFSSSSINQIYDLKSSDISEYSNVDWLGMSERNMFLNDSLVSFYLNTYKDTWINYGFDGQDNFEIYNDENYALLIKNVDKIAQAIILKYGKPLKTAYAFTNYDGSYNYPKYEWNLANIKIFVGFTVYVMKGNYKTSVSPYIVFYDKNKINKDFLFNYFDIKVKESSNKSKDISW